MLHSLGIANPRDPLIRNLLIHNLHTTAPKNIHAKFFIDTIQELFLFQHIQEPTRFRAGTTPSLQLDLVFTNEDNMINYIDYLPGAVMYASIFIYLAILPSNQTKALDTMYIELTSTMCMQHCIPSINLTSSSWWIL